MPYENLIVVGNFNGTKKPGGKRKGCSQTWMKAEGQVRKYEKKRKVKGKNTELVY